MFPRNLKKLPRSFYLRPTLKVARDLVGKYFVRRHRSTLLIGKIVEVEAYLGELDPASHAYRGKTKRNEVMFWKGGHLYVYFTYGMHFCANVVTEEEGKGRAVLIRAIEPVECVETMRRLRGLESDGAKRRNGEWERVTNGPAKFCKAFSIERKQNGADLLSDEIFIARDSKPPRHTVSASTRIGVTGGAEKRWRFFLKGSIWLSR